MPKATKPGRRERSKLDKERRIRDAAIALFREKGFEPTTTKEIADRADIATGTLFLYVKDKHELLFWVWRERLEQAIAKAAAKLPAKAPLVEQWMHFFEALFKLYHQDEALARNFIKEQLFRTPQPRDAEQLAAFFGTLSNLVEAAQARGEVRQEADPLMAAQSAFMLYVGALLQWLSGLGTQREALTGLRAALQQLFDGLAAK